LLRVFSSNLLILLIFSSAKVVSILSKPVVSHSLKNSFGRRFNFLFSLTVSVTNSL
jgi:hypothetical protein